MPPRIRVLTEQTINKIAAGEVIENPASVIKELIENSIDAKATEICVEISGGGRQLIRVTDNGHGMNHDDALLCLERHATSKIREVEDILDVHTMGFRGEAIPSIASISKFTLLTCPIQELGVESKATMVMVDGGQIIKCCSAERSPGTTIEVKSLFFNVPVRRKFQKSPAQDTSDIVKLMSSLALGNPKIKFQLIGQQESLLVAPFSRASGFLDILRERIGLTLGHDFASGLLSVDVAQGDCTLQGFIGQPQNNRHNRTGQYLFINQRPVISSLISNIMREAYGTTIGTHRHPICVLHLSLPGSFVDVNVHPQKREVRLRQEDNLRTLLFAGIEKALRHMPQDVPSSPRIDSPQSDFSTPISNEPFPWDLPWKTTPALTPAPAPAPAPLLVRRTVIETSLEPNLQPNESPLLPVPLRRPKLRAVETIPNFIIAANDESFGKLCILDQQAAHQRILYEGLERKQQAINEVQALLIPATLEFAYFEAAILKDHLEGLQSLGFSIKEFGRNTFIIDGIPTFLKSNDVRNTISELVQKLQETGSSGHLKLEKSKRLAMISSRLAVSSQEKLSLTEAQTLIDRLMGCEVPFQCPLGKSVMAVLNSEEIRNLLFK